MRRSASLSRVKATVVATLVAATVALAALFVLGAPSRRSHYVSLHFRVTDDRSPGCTVTLRIWARDRSQAQTLRLGLVSTSALHHVRFQCSLPRGIYRFVVTARDFSGNAQTRRGKNTLVVR